MRSSIIFAFIAVSGIVACAGSTASDDASSESNVTSGLASCAQEILLVCKEGSHDGCSSGLTSRHICVDNDEREGRPVACALEILRVCDPGFVDACTLTLAPVANHVCVAVPASTPGSSSGSTPGSSSGSTPGSSSGSTPAGGSCAQEILLVCPDGAVDGCTKGVTSRHACVLDESAAAASCALEFLRSCPAGFEDACIQSPAPSDKHVCAQKK